jgi:hypothetical protein
MKKKKVIKKSVPKSKHVHVYLEVHKGHRCKKDKTKE